MDFNFRQYDPQIGRFLSVDPLAAFGGQDSWSPYAAMGNNPGMMVDPLGLQFQSGGFAGSVGNIHVTILGTRYPESRFFAYSDPNFARTLELLEEYAYLSRRIHELRNPVPTLETAPGGISGPIAPMVFRGFYSAPAPVRPINSGASIDFTWQGSGFYRNFLGMRQVYGGDAWTRAAHWGMMPYKPDAMGITLSGNLMGLSGLNGSISFGVVGNKFGVWYTRGVGIGLPELSGGVSFFAANFKGGGVPTLESFARGSGDAFNGSIGAGGISLIGSYGRAFDNQGDVLWNSYSIGAGVYSPFHSLPINIGGSWQSTYSDIIWSW